MGKFSAQKRIVRVIDPQLTEFGIEKNDGLRECEWVVQMERVYRRVLETAIELKKKVQKINFFSNEGIDLEEGVGEDYGFGDL